MTALPPGAGRRAARRSDITLHQLRILWAIAHAETVSGAAKQLGLSQPSLSQQISKLETSLGTKLFQRRARQMVLTEAGAYLVDHAEQVLRDMQELEDGLSGFTGGARTIRIAGISSPMRVLLPLALKQFREDWPNVEFDTHESGPADVLAMLYARRVNIGLVAASSIAQASVGFLQVPFRDDPYVLVVPQALDLDGVKNQSDLSAEHRDTLNRTIQFVYGTQHQKRIEEWYDDALPDHRVIAQCRSFEGAIAMVRAGLGVCLAPALSCSTGEAFLSGLRLYDVALDLPRPLVALVPSQYRHLQPYAALIEALQKAGNAFPKPTIMRQPPFLRATIRKSRAGT